ncbi:MAG: divalent metal cation transporter, partial [Planctomycetaceae bacterium]
MAVEDPARIQRDRETLQRGKERGVLGTLWAYTRLSGPGWLQSAITLGGGTLAGSLYLGVLAGYGLMWLQPLAMILGIVMLSAIGYATLSTGQRPFAALNRHVNPLLGWAWALATLMANLIWCMPQFALGTAAIQQNLAPEVFGPTGSAAVPVAGIEGPTVSTLAVVAILFVCSAIVVWFYNTGGWGIKVFEFLLKAMVAIVVICFFGVVLKMSLTGALGSGEWAAILKGFIPDFTLFTQPSPHFDEALAATGSYEAFWSAKIEADQRQVMLTAAATAVGINMTFLLPYSMLARGWDRNFRGLAIFDLATGLFVPFLLATSCVIVAAASQFHAEPAPGFLNETAEDGTAIAPAGNLVGSFNGLLDDRLKTDLGEEKFAALSDDEKQNYRDGLPEADRRMAAMLVKRDAANLANSLERLTGKEVAQYLFGVGVLGMAISTIIILMLINGFVVCEMLGAEQGGWVHRGGAFLAAAVGATGPFLYQGDARFWLA